jgi:hypothetical protein
MAVVIAPSLRYWAMFVGAFEFPEKLTSGAKARLHFCGAFGTTKVVPFQNVTIRSLSKHHYSCPFKTSLFVPFQNATIRALSKHRYSFPFKTSLFVPFQNFDLRRVSTTDSD